MDLVEAVSKEKFGIYAGKRAAHQMRQRRSARGFPVQKEDLDKEIREISQDIANAGDDISLATEAKVYWTNATFRVVHNLTDGLTLPGAVGDDLDKILKSQDFSLEQKAEKLERLLVDLDDRQYPDHELHPAVTAADLVA